MHWTWNVEVAYTAVAYRGFLAPRGKKWNGHPFSWLFSEKFSKMVDPEQIEVIFKSEKQKKKKRVLCSPGLFLFSHFYTSTKIYLYTHFINSFELLYVLWQICAKWLEWLVYYFFYQVDFSAPPKVAPGARVLRYDTIQLQDLFLILWHIQLTY